MARFSLRVNGVTRSIETDDPNTPLLYVLRNDLGLHGPKFGCGLAQCGYCINGMIMTAKAWLDTHPRPTEAEVKTALAQNLCRCGTHVRIVRAVLRAAQALLG